jgi:hypothetical protein
MPPDPSQRVSCKTLIRKIQGTPKLKVVFGKKLSPTYAEFLKLRSKKNMDEETK